MTKKIFDELLNDGQEIILESNKTFTFESPAITFKYKFLLSITDFALVYENLEVGKSFGACLMIVPTKRYLAKDVLKTTVGAVCGTMENYNTEVKNLGARDLDECGYSIKIAAKPAGFTDECKFEGFSSEEIQYVIGFFGAKLDDISANLDCFLSKPQNMTGETGWQMLSGWLKTPINYH